MDIQPQAGSARVSFETVSPLAPDNIKKPTGHDHAEFELINHQK